MYNRMYNQAQNYLEVKAYVIRVWGFRLVSLKPTSVRRTCPGITWGGVLLTASIGCEGEA